MPPAPGTGAGTAGCTAGAGARAHDEPSTAEAAAAGGPGCGRATAPATCARFLSSHGAAVHDRPRRLPVTSAGPLARGAVGAGGRPGDLDSTAPPAISTALPSGRAPRRGRNLEQL